jgi:predicted dithiol-disulfide oxidoreductase (DUF899 family)
MRSMFTRSPKVHATIDYINSKNELLIEIFMLMCKNIIYKQFYKTKTRDKDCHQCRVALCATQARTKEIDSSTIAIILLSY